MAETLQYDITENGKGQGDTVKFLKNTRDIVNDMQSVFNTNRTSQTTSKTAVDELRTNNDLLVTLLDQVKALTNSVISILNSSIRSIATLAISGTAEKFKTTTSCIYSIDGAQYTKAATDNLVFTAADTINTAGAAGTFWGGWTIEIAPDGTVSTVSVSSDQVYATEAAAVAALQPVTAGNVILGWITVNSNDTTAWTANTDDMTAGSDCVAANFYDATATAWPAEISAPNIVNVATAEISAPGAAITETTPLTLSAG